MFIKFKYNPAQLAFALSGCSEIASSPLYPYSLWIWNIKAHIYVDVRWISFFVFASEYGTDVDVDCVVYLVLEMVQICRYGFRISYWICYRWRCGSLILYWIWYECRSGFRILVWQEMELDPIRHNLLLLCPGCSGIAPSPFHLLLVWGTRNQKPFNLWSKN